ncbi:MAG: hypothetical protein U0176_19490 [Bacteroidia bacterium]
MRHRRVAILILMVMAGAAGTLHAQNNRLQLATPQRPILHSAPSSDILPQHIRTNPQGHAPLCRMETKIERQAPVGVWMRLDGPTSVQGVNAGWAALRFRVPLR